MGKIRKVDLTDVLINEINEKASKNDIENIFLDIGDKTLVNTTNKESIVGAINEINEKVDSQKADYETFIDKVEKELSNYNSYASQKDNNGVFKVVEYKRADKTLYMKSTLSNPNVEGNYQTVVWEIYNDLGTVIENTITWNISYDADGDIVSKVVVI